MGMNLFIHQHMDDTAAPFDCNGEGEIYIVWPREFIVAGVSILKGGRSIDSAVRLRAYPKGSRLLVRLRVSRMLDAENMLMSVCKAAFIHRTDIGSEYFEGSNYDVVGMALQVARMFPVTPVPVPLAIVAPHPRPTIDDADADVERPAKRCRTDNEPISIPRSDVELVDALVASSHLLNDRIRFDPASNTATATAHGFFLCDPSDNVWRGICNNEVDGIIVDAVKACKDDMHLSVSELHRIGSRKAARNIIIPSFSRHSRISDSLDSPRDLFAVRNGVLDTRSKTFRPIVPDDHISITSHWEYDPDAAIRHRPALDAFIEAVFPVPVERRVVLRYIAALITDTPPIEKILALATPCTDTFDGSCSSSFVKLVRMFFGSARAPDVKLVCNASLTPDLTLYRGSRIVVADELKRSNPIDVALLTRLTNGGAESPWRAGFLIVLDPCDHPELDVNGNGVLARRMIVAHPARGPMGLDGNGGRGGVLSDWMSALADVLMDLCGTDAIDVPIAMDGWRGVEDRTDHLAEWLNERVIITKDPNDRIVLGDLKKVYFGSLPPKDFIRGANAFFSSCPGAVCLPKDNVKRCGVWTSNYHVVRGAVHRVSSPDLVEWLRTHTVVTGVASDFVLLVDLRRMYGDKKFSGAEFDRFAQAYFCSYIGTSYLINSTGPNRKPLYKVIRGVHMNTLPFGQIGQNISKQVSNTMSSTAKTSSLASNEHSNDVSMILRTSI